MRAPAASSWASLTAILCVLACSAPACLKAPDSSAITEVIAPDYLQFKGALPGDVPLPATQAGVSRVLERRCGTLDCHGHQGRPLLIYGQLGLRLIDDAGNISGVAPTSDAETQANYQAVVGLQPEEMTRVVQRLDPPEALLLLRKPLQLERHEGGQVIEGGDSAYQCITTWLGGQTDFTSCAAAVQ